MKTFVIFESHLVGITYSIKAKNKEEALRKHEEGESEKIKERLCDRDIVEVSED